MLYALPLCSNFGDTATITNTCATSVKEICDEYKGNTNGKASPAFFSCLSSSCLVPLLIDAGSFNVGASQDQHRAQQLLQVHRPPSQVLGLARGDSETSDDRVLYLGAGSSWPSV